MGFISAIKKAREDRQKKLLEWKDKKIATQVGFEDYNYNQKVVPTNPKYTSTNAKTTTPQVVTEMTKQASVVGASTAAAAATSSVAEKTFMETASSFTDNIVNPENHPEVPVKQVSSDEPTEDDDEESQDDLDNDDKDDAGESTADPTSPVANVTSPISPLLDQIKSDDGNTTIVETFSPPNLIKPMEKEAMETFIAEQRAQEKTGLLCGCI